MMDEARRQEVQSWLDKALQDLQSAEWLLESPHNLYNAIGFHCQQASEKALKAYLTWREKPFEKTYSLVALVALCLPFENHFETLRQAATTLSPYAATIRYPGDLPNITKEEATEAIRLVKQILEFVVEHLPSD